MHEAGGLAKSRVRVVVQLLGETMTDRVLKILVTLVLGSMVTLLVAHNLANLGAAHGFFLWATSPEGNEAYPINLLPPPPAALVVLGMIVVLALETAAGFLLLLGSWRMWRARHATAPQFRSAKTFAKLGLGCTIANWWGMFQAIAVGGYQIWQKPDSVGPDHGSWVMGAMAILILIYLSQPEETSAVA